jgi:hypothetical protein
MSIWQIREAIAESGKMTVTEVMAYFKTRYPSADMKVVKSEAKDLISEMKKYR